MKKLLVMYSDYNYKTNKSICKLMMKVSDEQLKMERPIYYKNLYSLYKHLIIGSWHYLNAIHFLTDKKYCNSLPPLFDESTEVEIESMNDIMMQLSSILKRVSTSISNLELEIKKRKIKIYNGRILDMSIWQYFLQHITHQIHHQGQMSIIFDELGMDHEFGNIFPLIEESI